MSTSGLRSTKSILITLGIMMLGACGGSSDGSSAQPVSSTADQSDDGSAEPEQDSPEPATGDAGATVTIGGTTHEFGPDEVFICMLDENGLFRATLASADYTQNLEISLPPEGYITDDPLNLHSNYASVLFQQSETEMWFADAYESDPKSVNNREIPEGLTQVDSYDFDSGGASGTATFLNMEALTFVEDHSTGDPVSGSFAISCG